MGKDNIRLYARYAVTTARRRQTERYLSELTTKKPYISAGTVMNKGRSVWRKR